MQRKFIFFINPISGTQNKAVLKMIIEKKAATHNIEYRFMDTNKYGDYKFLPVVISKEKITDIIICGGDGTVNQIASALLNINVNVGIVPMGSGNGLAFTAGIPKAPGKAMDIILKQNAIAVDAFYINEHFSCMLCGLGFDAQVAHDFAKQSSRGLATYAKQTFRNFFRAKPYPFVIDINNKKIATEAFFISIANSNQFGNHVTIAPKASLSDGLIDIVIVSKMSKLNMILSLIKQIKAGKLQDRNDLTKPGIQYFQTDKLVIENPGLAPLHIDGDPALTSGRFEIKIIEKAFRLLHP